MRSASTSLKIVGFDWPRRARMGRGVSSSALSHLALPLRERHHRPSASATVLEEVLLCTNWTAGELAGSPGAHGTVAIIKPVVLVANYRLGHPTSTLTDAYKCKYRATSASGAVETHTHSWTSIMFDDGWAGLCLLSQSTSVQIRRPYFASWCRI